jgi:hypothetical protein
MSRAEWAMPARFATTAKVAASAFGRGVKILIAEHSLAQRVAARAGLARQRLRDIRALYLYARPRRE